MLGLDNGSLLCEPETQTLWGAQDQILHVTLLGHGLAGWFCEWGQGCGAMGEIILARGPLTRSGPGQVPLGILGDEQSWVLGDWQLGSILVFFLTLKRGSMQCYKKVYNAIDSPNISRSMSM